MRDVAKPYDERYVNAPSRRSGPKKTMSYYMTGVMAVQVPARGGTTIALGDKVLADITKADIEALRAHWQTRDKKLSKGGLVGVNRMLRRVRHFFNWATRTALGVCVVWRRSWRAGSGGVMLTALGSY
jgi:hypothetical protein